ncbi:MAG: ribonuclease III domain-containing protein [Eubacteriales bacterium]|nr:ribonuclease III domain-containing protein [Eubacteriales bacterium]
MSNLLDINSDIHSLSPLSLAFVGDSVYDLLVRQHLVTLANRPVKELNQMKVTLVNCKSQAQSAKAIMDKLTEDELDVYKRGRNVKVNSASKHSSIADYHSATGLECLFGYLYLSGNTDRIKELFELILINSEV